MNHHPQPQPHPAPGVGVALCRRCFALSPIILCAYNTTLSIQQAVYQMSITRPMPDTLSPQPVLLLQALPDYVSPPLGEGWFSCDHAILPEATVTCPVTLSNNLAYACFLAVWLSYFAVLLCYHGYYVSLYDAATDLRHFIAIRKAASAPMHSAYIALGGVLTLVSAGYALVRAQTNEVTAGSASVLQSIVLFVLLNGFLLKQFVPRKADAIPHIDLAHAFPRPIYCPYVPLVADRCVWNGYGRVVSVEHVFTVLLVAVAQEQLLQGQEHGDAAPAPAPASLSACGDATSIRRALRILYCDRPDGRPQGPEQGEEQGWLLRHKQEQEQGQGQVAEGVPVPPAGGGSAVAVAAAVALGGSVEVVGQGQGQGQGQEAEEELMSPLLQHAQPQARSQS